MLWIKAFHVITAVTWFAGLFYLPRLFVYHAMCEDREGLERFKVMERKLYRGIMTPSSILTVALVVWMLVEYGWVAYGHSGWLHVKLFLVVLLLVYHHLCGRYLRAFREERNRHGHVFFRWFNEVPVLFLVGIVILVVVRPF